MTRSLKLLLIAGLLAVGALFWFFTRPVITLSDDSPIWSSEDDAARQGTIFPGPVTSKAILKKGDKIKVVWVKYGKDYRAAFVLAPDFQTGWILTTQRGISG